MSVWVNGRHRSTLDFRDRGLQYGDGLFETMRVRQQRIRLLDHHLDRLTEGCRRLGIGGQGGAQLRAELERMARRRDDGILKLIVTRGSGPRGYRASGREHPTRVVSLHALSKAGLHEAVPVRVRLCATPVSVNTRLAGLKTLNRLDSVLARAEWRDVRVWEGLMSDPDGNWVCGTMSNLFVRHGVLVATPLLDKCGVAGVMRRWVLESAASVGLRVEQRRIRCEDLMSAEEIFMSNAVVGIRSVRAIERTPAGTLRTSSVEAACRLRARLDMQ
jgi:4-amino-4-deoxychorismate lyase